MPSLEDSSGKKEASVLASVSYEIHNNLALSFWCGWRASLTCTDGLQNPFGCWIWINRLKLPEKMLLTDLQEANGNNCNKIISKGRELCFNPAAASLREMTTTKDVTCLAAFEAESQCTTRQIWRWKTAFCIQYRNKTQSYKYFGIQHESNRGSIFSAFSLLFLSSRIGHRVRWNDDWCHI